MKQIEPIDKVVAQLPPAEAFNSFGRATKLLIHPKDVPEVKFTRETSETSEVSVQIHELTCEQTRTPAMTRDEAMELETSEILQVLGKYRPEKTGWCTRVLGVAMNNVWCSIKEGLENAAQSNVNFGGSDCIESIQDTTYW